MNFRIEMIIVFNIRHKSGLQNEPVGGQMLGENKCSPTIFVPCGIDAGKISIFI